MTRNEYVEQIKNDLKENGYEEIIKDVGTESAYDKAFIDDSITGNASGSYTFNSYQARENIECAENIIQDLIYEYGMTSEEVAKHVFDYEYWDVSIRCYLLADAIAELEMEME